MINFSFSYAEWYVYVEYHSKIVNGKSKTVFIISHYFTHKPVFQSHG